MNILPVIVTAVIGFLIGGIWYSPLLFGKTWQRLTKQDMKGASMGVQLVGTLIATFFMAYVLDLYIAATASFSVTLGMQAAFWLWLGLVVSASVTRALYEKRSWKLVLIDIGHYLVVLLAMGAILARW
jgi:hypothetical protein